MKKILIAFNVAVGDLPMIPMLIRETSVHFDYALYGGKANYFVSHSSHRRKLQNHMTLFHDVVDNEYPPVNKTFRTYEHMLHAYPRYDWYVRCDADAYVNASLLRATIDRYDEINDAVAFGSFAWGREHERRDLHLDGNFTHYLNGGACEAVNAAAMLRLNATSIETCRRRSRSLVSVRFAHSDVEISRCLIWSGVTLRHESSMRTVSFTRTPNSGRLESGSPCETPTAAATMHPFKAPHMHLLLHRRELCDLKSSPKRATMPIPRRVPTFIITRIEHPRLSLPSPFHVVRVLAPSAASSASPFLTRGEVSYRDAMRRLLVRGSQYPIFASFDDDVRFSKTVERDWQDILHNRPMGGVLQMGASIWSTRTWREVLQVRSRVWNGTSGVCGSFAVLWSRPAAIAAIAWIDATVGLYPFDNVWPFLQELGYLWNFVHPPLAIMNVEKTSSIDPLRDGGSARRHELHRWGPSSEYSAVAIQRCHVELR